MRQLLLFAAVIPNKMNFPYLFNIILWFYQLRNQEVTQVRNTLKDTLFVFDIDRSMFGLVKTCKVNKNV